MFFNIPPIVGLLIFTPMRKAQRVQGATGTRREHLRKKVPRVPMQDTTICDIYHRLDQAILLGAQVF